MTAKFLYRNAPDDPSEMNYVAPLPASVSKASDESSGTAKGKKKKAGGSDEDRRDDDADGSKLGRDR